MTRYNIIRFRFRKSNSVHGQLISRESKTIDQIIEEVRTSKISERSGRAQDKERAYAMQKLRALGYM